MEQKGVLFIVCGPSGVGKTTLSEEMLRRFERLTFSVSVTTRPPRDYEVDGEDYHFVDEQQFEAMREEGAFVEWARVHGNYYGTTFATLSRAWEEGRDLLFDIDYQGARQLKESFPDATSVLVVPPSMEVLRDRLTGRGSESEETLQTRLTNAREELAQYEIYDFIIENDDFEDAADDLACVYRCATFRRRFQAERVEELLAP